MQSYRVSNIIEKIVPVQLQKPVFVGLLDALLTGIFGVYERVVGVWFDNYYFDKRNYPAYSKQLSRLNNQVVNVRVNLGNEAGISVATTRKFVTNFQALSGYTQAFNEVVLSYDNENQYLKFIEGTGSHTIQIQDSTLISLPYSALIEELATSTQLIDLSTPARSLLIEETEPGYDSIIGLHFPPGSFAPSVFDKVTEARREAAATALSQFKMYGRIIKVELI